MKRLTRQNKKRDIRLYNALFPLWMLLIFPLSWLVVLPGNFVIDSAVLLLSMLALKIADKKSWYKKHILKIYLFGLLADIIGSAYMILVASVFDIAVLWDEWYLTVPGLLIAAALIFVFNYFVTFRKAEKGLRWKSALIFAVVTAPYTFLVPSRWLYNF